MLMQAIRIMEGFLDKENIIWKGETVVFVLWEMDKRM